MQELPQVGRAQPPVSRVPAALRLTHLALNWLVFSLCYPLGNFLAQQQQTIRSLALALDAAIPFLPWMVVPYATSGIFFTLVFLLVRTGEQLRVASRRLMLATVAGSLVFVMAPARFSLERPTVADAVPAELFRWLELVDQPFNQFPSLHVAYCLVFWCALRPLYRRAVRMMLAAWLLLVGASTVFTWQHHLPDVAGGLLLGWAAIHTVRPGATRRHTISFYYTIMAGMLLLVGVAALRSWVAGYAAFSLLLVAAAYYARRADFLLKQAGCHPLRSWLLFWPYLAGYRLTWLLVRLRERGRPALLQPVPGLWIGRRLSSAEAGQLPPGCHVIDLCGELPETSALRRQGYCHVPLLDMQAPRPRQLRRVLAAIAHSHAKGFPVFVHCAMGYSRSRLIARLYRRKNHPCPIRSTS